MLFTNLPLRYLYDTPAYGELFMRQNLNPELGLDALALERIPQSWHLDTASMFRHAGLGCAAHLPFMDLHPGSADPRARQLCEDRLRQAIDIAQIYQPAHYVAHLDFVEWMAGTRREDWLEKSLTTWNAVLSHLEPTPLFLENVCEQEPRPLLAVLEGLAGKARMCFDLGHWHSFGQGHARGNLEEWLTELGPWIGHLHLHDNDGSADQHRGLGCGGIAWLCVEHFLRTRPHISATLEPHTLDDFQATQNYLAAHPELGQAIGWQP